MIRTEKFLRTLQFGGNVQTASIDLHWSGDYRVPKSPSEMMREYSDKVLNVFDPSIEFWREFESIDALVIPPGSIRLLRSAEAVQIPQDHGAILMSRSTPGRRGLLHAHTGWFEGGFKGHATWEVYNGMPFAVVVPRGQAMVQLVFIEADTATQYAGRYQECG